jgi:hypothetical protein
MAMMMLQVPVSGLGIDGCSISCGLAEHGGERIDPSAWRAVLLNGKLPAQHPVKRRIMAEPSPVVIRYGG